MVRLFSTHRIRPSVELDGLWDFSPLPPNGKFPKRYDCRLPVPGCWESHPAFRSYRGRGAYRRRFQLDNDTALRLEFKGVSHTADIFLDGRKIGHHYNAYTPFQVVVPRVTGGTHELVVIAGNRFNEQSALHIPNDYYSYGGISRPVVLEQIGDAFIERLRFVPSVRSGRWSARVEVVVTNVSRRAARVRPCGALAGTTLAFGAKTVAPGATTTFGRVFAFDRVTPWSAGNPALYLLDMRLYDGGSVPCDDLIERVGFRTVSVRGRRILVNGAPVFFKGFNRHEDHPAVGCSFPVQLMAADLALMRDMNANAVRTCHYPNDELFLDLCDELGFYVWEENHARGLKLEHMRNPHFRRQCSDCNREMVTSHFNHPSIFIWGLLNECASNTPGGRAMYKEQIRQIRGLDKSRPVTFATCHPFSDLSLGLEDIFSLNQYARWYGDSDPEELYLKTLRWAVKAGARGKPVIMSEFGAGGIPGLRDPARMKWTEERQAEILEETMRAYLSRPEICGLFIWQFCDVRVCDGDWSLRRPRTMNNKGVVDEFRRPKLAYETVKRIYGGVRAERSPGRSRRVEVTGRS